MALLNGQARNDEDSEEEEDDTYSESSSGSNSSDDQIEADLYVILFNHGSENSFFF
jgi:hypothetical protein